MSGTDDKYPMKVGGSFVGKAVIETKQNHDIIRLIRKIKNNPYYLVDSKLGK